MQKLNLKVQAHADAHAEAHADAGGIALVIIVTLCKGALMNSCAK